jgi:sucrose-6-phosphate hydrolase SacC (GH32 family)
MSLSSVLRRPLSEIMFAFRVFTLLIACCHAYKDPQKVLKDEGTGRYNGDLRPQIHFSPERNWMNDPNGLFIDGDKTWHLYYQCQEKSR